MSGWWNWGDDPRLDEWSSYSLITNEPVGRLPLTVGGKTYWITGGPISAADQVPGAFRVNLSLTQQHAADLRLPTEDFGCPPADAMQAAVAQTLDVLFSDRAVYAGCVGGKGRTGLFLACMAKAIGTPDPLTYVRFHYHRHAVESLQQGRFLRDWTPGGRVVAKVMARTLKNRAAGLLRL